jgi:hypothetical protein
VLETLGGRGVRALQIVFWSALFFAVAFALAPLPQALDEWDYALHCLAFYALACAALVAFPWVSTWRLALGLFLCGAFIEWVQILPIFGHTAQIGDLAADLVGAAAALVPARLGSWRARWRRAHAALDGKRSHESAGAK